jgi:hypothetical protein
MAAGELLTARAEVTALDEHQGLGAHSGALDVAGIRHGALREGPVYLGVGLAMRQAAGEPDCAQGGAAQSACP